MAQGSNEPYLSLPRWAVATGFGIGYRQQERANQSGSGLANKWAADPQWQQVLLEVGRSDVLTIRRRVSAGMGASSSSAVRDHQNGAGLDQSNRESSFERPVLCGVGVLTVTRQGCVITHCQLQGAN